MFLSRIKDKTKKTKKKISRTTAMATQNEERKTSILRLPSPYPHLDRCRCMHKKKSE
jgi:hypothetical protein